MNHAKSTWGSWLLLATVSAAPWLNGGADAVPQAILYLAMTLVAVALWWDQRRGASPLRVPATALVCGLGVLLGVVHLLPVWPVNSEGFAPATVALRAQMSWPDTDAAMNSEQPSLSDEQRMQTGEQVPWTLDAHATRQTLVLILVCTLVLIASATWYNDLEAMARLAHWSAMNGALLTLFAVLVKATWNGKLYWIIPVGFGRGVFGPIVYHNQAGNVLMMTTAAAWFAFLNHRGIANRPKHKGLVLQRAARWEWPEGRTLWHWFLLGINLAGLLLTLSRGALLATIVSALVMLLLVRPRQGWSGMVVPVGVALVAAIGLVGWFRAADLVSSRYATFMQADQLLADTRLDHWQDGIRAAKDYGQLGVGLGAYRHIHLLYQDSEIQRVFLRAHNQYLETWADAGIPGLLLLFGQMVLVGWSIRHLMQRGDPRLRNLARLGILLLVGQSVHAMVDFCLYLPATAVMFAMYVGAIGGGALASAEARHLRRWPMGWTVGGVRQVFVATAMLVPMVWGTWWSVRWAREELALYAAPWNESQAEIEEARLAQSIARLETLVARTDDWRVPLALGELYLARYRAEMRQSLGSELTLEEASAIDAATLWSFTDPLVLSVRAHELAADGQTQVIEEEIRAQPLVRRWITAAHDQFRPVRRLCPLIAQAHLRLGELLFVRAQPGDYQDHRDLDRAARCAVGNPDLLFDIGRRYATAGQDALALTTWRSSLALSSRRWPEIYAAVGEEMTAREMLERLLPADPRLYLMMAGKHLTEPEQHGVREVYLARAGELLGDQASGNKDQRARWYLDRAELALLRQQRPMAIESIRAALKLRPEDHSLRAQLAQLLALEKDYEAALREARYSLQLQPGNWEYRLLIDQMTRDREKQREQERAGGEQLERPESP